MNVFKCIGTEKKRPRRPKCACGGRMRLFQKETTASIYRCPTCNRNEVFIKGEGLQNAPSLLNDMAQVIDEEIQRTFHSLSVEPGEL